MGHIMVSSMQKAQAALEALTVEEHGVDGKSIYLYGEAWDFGECAGNQRGRNACQVNISGTGLGEISVEAAASFSICSGKLCSGGKLGFCHVYRVCFCV